MQVCCSSVLILKSILSKAMWRVCCFVKRLAPVDMPIGELLDEHAPF
jgi:hypothetical protein